MEAIAAKDKNDASAKVLYSRPIIIVFPVVSSAGASAFWFKGSWYDMIVAGTLAFVVYLVGSSKSLSKQQRLIYEVVAGFIASLVAGLVNLRFPDETCFVAMALASLLDLLQGFRAVYAVMEIMSKHTVTGCADFVEAVLFSALIAYVAVGGDYVAAAIMSQDPTAQVGASCTNGINEWWFFLLVPLASLCWSGLLDPDYADLPVMTFHGVLAYVVSWALDQSTFGAYFYNFVAAMSVTFSAGLVSRWTGRQAIGNTVAGLYALVPGIFLVKQILTDKMEGYIEHILISSVVLGLGAWTGTVLCTPVVFGTTDKFHRHSSSAHGHESPDKKVGPVFLF